MRFELRLRLLAAEVASGRIDRDKAVRKIVAHDKPMVMTEKTLKRKLKRSRKPRTI